MTEMNEHPRRILPARRLTLLGSVAVLGSAMLLAGPMGYGRFAEPASAATTQAQQGPAAFSDLIAKVKPAVISVRVKVDKGVDISGLEQNDEETPPRDHAAARVYQKKPAVRLPRPPVEGTPNVEPWNPEPGAIRSRT